jgi:predicted amidohydrolase
MEQTTSTDPIYPNLHQLGNARGRGNLLGIAPYMIPDDYLSRESFFNKLDLYLRIAQHEGWLNEKTIIVFPEYIGTWLVLTDENEKISHAPTLATAERALVLRHLPRFIAHFWKASEKGRAEAAIFRVKAESMAEIYQNVFSRLARDYAATIVAGSIVLPAPQISSRRLLLSNGPLHNISIVYQPDGSPHPRLIHKAFPTSKELPFIKPGSAGDIPSFETPAGRLGVLICADSWYPQAYAPLKEQGIDILAVPSYDTLGMQYWQHPWPGYNGWSPPADVDVNDIMKITEAQAWQKYSLAGRIQSSGATYGMNIFLRGKLWDQDLGGKPATLVRENKIFIEEPTEKAAMQNIWL